MLPTIITSSFFFIQLIWRRGGGRRDNADGQLKRKSSGDEDKEMAPFQHHKLFIQPPIPFARRWLRSRVPCASRPCSSCVASILLLGNERCMPPRFHRILQNLVSLLNLGKRVSGPEYKVQMGTQLDLQGSY